MILCFKKNRTDRGKLFPFVRISQFNQENSMPQLGENHLGSISSDTLFYSDVQTLQSHLKSEHCNRRPTKCCSLSIRIFYECEGGIKKICPEDQRLASRGLPSEDKRQCSPMAVRHFR